MRASAESLLRRGYVPRASLVAFVAIALLLPASAFAYTRYQYFSGTSYGGTRYGVETSGYEWREYNDAYHNTGDEWQVTYYLSGGVLDGESTTYSSPTALGYEQYAARAGCDTVIANTTGYAYSCATTVP